MAARFKLVFFCPTQNTSDVLNKLFTKLPTELGKIGNYEQCAFLTRGTGQFKPLSGANPTIGQPDKLEHVEEDRVEIMINDEGKNDQVKVVVQELKAVHPYEEVAYDIYRLENF